MISWHSNQPSRRNARIPLPQPRPFRRQGARQSPHSGRIRHRHGRRHGLPWRQTPIQRRQPWQLRPGLRVLPPDGRTDRPCSRNWRRQRPNTLRVWPRFPPVLSKLQSPRQTTRPRPAVRQVLPALYGQYQVARFRGLWLSLPMRPAEYRSLLWQVRSGLRRFSLQWPAMLCFQPVLCNLWRLWSAGLPYLPCVR